MFDFKRFKISIVYTIIIFLLTGLFFSIIYMGIIVFNKIVHLYPPALYPSIFFLAFLSILFFVYSITKPFKV